MCAIMRPWQGIAEVELSSGLAPFVSFIIGLMPAVLTDGLPDLFPDSFSVCRLANERRQLRPWARGSMSIYLPAPKELDDF